MTQRSTPVTAACVKCEIIDWCQRKGCVVWNDSSRAQFLELRRRSKETNDWIDEFERDITALKARP